MGLCLARSTGPASVEWVMGRYFTPDTVSRDTRQKRYATFVGDIPWIAADLRILF